MSRPWILGIVCCLLFASSTAIGWSQEYLDLPDDPSEQTTSLSDRLSSFRDKFRRKSKPQQPSENATSRSRPTAPRYRNTAQASLQAQQRARNVSNQNAAKPRPPAPIASTQSKARVSQPRVRSSNEVVARPKTADLLPDTLLFSRGRQPLPPVTQLKSKQFSTATNVPRAGSSNNKSVSPKVARLSPATSRANELDAALADLVATKSTTKQPTKKIDTKAAALQPPVLKSEPAAVQVTASNTFDLRKALRDDEAEKEELKKKEAEKIAQQAAEAAKLAAAEQAKAEAAKAKAAAAKSAESSLADAIKVAPKAVEQPTIESTKLPMVVAQTQSPPLPTIIAAPVNNEPIVIQANPQPAITIATPRPSPTLPSTTSSEFVNDPFERASTPAYQIEQTSSNPMREFQPEFEPAQPTQSFARPQTGILQTMQQPVIVSQVEGPRSILVGREATYQVTLENTSTSAAKNLSAEITVPEWAELVDAMSTSGVVERSDNGATAGALEWKLSELPARSSQALRLRLIPRSGRPLQIGVRWSQAAIQSQAIVEVQEPKLELAIAGPQEVRFGKPQRYRLTLRNPGTGTTENVSLRLVPPGGDANSPTTQAIGNLKAGEVRDIDLELTAREAGELLIQADAVADGGLKAETTKAVLCRKPELKVDWRGPDKKYAGTVAAYYFRVSNPGTAATEPVEMSVKLPVGTEFVSASEGFTINATTGIINWSLASLDADEEQFMQLRCKIVRPGSNDFLVTAECDDSQLQDSKAFQTEVIALADLKLEVSDPQGPLPLGEAVVYEIRVRNRGTTGAEHINVVGLFSEGIEPTTVEGAQYNIRDGRVSFHPIKSLPAGREVVLRIHAKAKQSGTHIFRTEVTCPKLDIKLAAEETTRFFEEEHRWENGQTPYMAERESTSTR